MLYQKHQTFRRFRSRAQLGFVLMTLVGLGFPMSQRAAVDQIYTITDLGTLGGATTVANKINNRGEVVGTSRIASGQQHAYLYSNGVMTDLGTFGGPESFGNNINDRGQVVGAADLPDGIRHAFLYENGVKQDLGALPGHTFGTAFGINNRGEVVGGSRPASPPIFRAVSFKDGAVIDLGTLDGPSSFAVRINDLGQVVGRADLASGFSRAFLYEDGVMKDLGTLPGDTASFASDINDRGQVVARSVSASASRAFLWQDGVMQDLGTLGGNLTEPSGINIRRQVVGRARTATSGTATRAFLWENGVMKDLNELIPAGSGWVLLQATAINAAGQIVGNGTLNGQDRAFLLTPRR